MESERIAIQITGVILSLIAVPLLIMHVRNWFFATQSVGWPTCAGVVDKGLSFTIYGTLDFSYEYVVNGKTFKCNRPYLTGSFKNVGRKKENELINFYPVGKPVTVSYHPEKPQLSVLEPGRKEGVLSTIIQLIILASVAIFAILKPNVIVDLIR
ncbi:MAG: DUF3592 domain-containing protein [Cyclobacteriaceae bacterium]|jgi:hypothetical protein|nr:DUF3592 domain-containing protein [Cyclobacteriaceae bacterium]